MKCNVIDFIEWKRKAIGMVYRGNGVWSRELSILEIICLDKKKPMPSDYQIIKHIQKRAR